MSDIYSASGDTPQPDVPYADDGESPGPVGQGQPGQGQPLYRIYTGSRLAVSSAVGKMFKRKLDAAIKAHEHVNEVWEQCFRYYNNNQNKTQQTPRGLFKRGDCTENVIFSNLNIMLPAVYSKDPDVTCSTTDEGDEAFCKSLEALVNALFRRKDGLNAKPKIKKGTGQALLTNFGVLKLTFTQKGDSREFAMQEMQRITDALKQAKNQAEVQDLYGQLEALEVNMEVMEPSGFGLSNVLPHNLIVDPYAEQPDGLDATFMAERVWLSTAFLRSRYTQPAENSEESNPQNDTRVLVYAPTHKAVFADGSAGSRDDGLGVVMQEINRRGNEPTSYTEDERTAYLDMYFTECYYVWDKITRRVYLFHRDDWTWPLWVWDDPLKVTRFFPYFIIGFVMSTGGTVSPGETAYILDQQDEINDINRQKARIRRSIFDFFFFNSDITNADEVEKFVEAIRGTTTTGKHVVGIRAGERKISEMIEAFAPPAAHYETLFDTKPVLDSINRISNTSDALRGIQFKTNTNVASVQSYQESMRLSVGSKVDVVEDVVADLALAVAEIAVQNYDQDIVTGYIGNALAAGWMQMDLPTFHSTYSLTIVSGSMEKPNSVFKKKEAIEVSQAIGQFAQAAPGTTMRIMLRVLSQAFTEVVIKPEEWDALDAEIAASMQKGVSTGSGGGDQTPGGSAGAGGGGGAQNDLEAQAKNLPDAAKQHIVQMHENGASSQDILAFVQSQVQQKTTKRTGVTTNGQTEPAK